MRHLIRFFGLVVPLIGVILSVATSTNDEMTHGISSEREGETIMLTVAQPRADLVVEVTGNDALFSTDDAVLLSVLVSATIVCFTEPCAFQDGGPSEADPSVRVIQQLIRDGAPLGSASMVLLSIGDVENGSQSFGELNERSVQVFVRFELVDGAVDATVEWSAHGLASVTTKLGEDAPEGAEVLLGFSDAPPGFEPVLFDGDAGLGSDSGGP